MSIESVILSNHLILSHRLLLLPSVFPGIRVFPNRSALLIRWQSFGASTSVLPINIQDSYPLGFDLLAVQRTLKSLQHCSSKATIFKCSTFFMVQLSHPYLTAGKTIALTMLIFVIVVTSLLYFIHWQGRLLLFFFKLFSNS